ncbi:MAG: hypothetical protein LBJ89_00490 [Holosporales bacterium]|jgi:hypothetical protein|nr:hypothetical protein [Holosporales bacterium]
MRRFIFVFTLVATGWCAEQYNTAVRKVNGDISDLKLSVNFENNGGHSDFTRPAEFTVPANFLKLCRFLMFANPMSDPKRTGDPEDNASLEKSLTPLTISGELKPNVTHLVNTAFSGRNVVVTQRGGQRPVIICSGIGVLYTTGEKIQLESCLGAEVLDIFDVAGRESTYDAGIPIIPISRDNLVKHGLLIRLRNEISGFVTQQNSEQIAIIRSLCSRLIQLDAVDLVDPGLKQEVNDLANVPIMDRSHRDHIVDMINQEIAKCRYDNKTSLQRIRLLIVRLITSNQGSCNNGRLAFGSRRRDFDFVGNWLNMYFSDQNIDEKIDNFVLQITEPAVSSLSGFVDDYNVILPTKPSDEATRHISDMLHSEALYIYWYENQRTSSEIEYFFTQRDMCQSCDDRVAEWMQRGSNHPTNLLVLSAQMCNRSLASSVDCIAVLKNKIERAPSPLKLPAERLWKKEPTTDTRENVTVNVENIEGRKGWHWEICYPYHPARLQLEPGTRKMVKGLIRVRVPALTLRRTDEYQSPGKYFDATETGQKWKTMFWNTAPHCEPVWIDENFNGRQKEYSLPAVFPRRAGIVSATCEYLKDKFYVKGQNKFRLGINGSLLTESSTLPASVPLLNVWLNFNSALGFIILHNVRHRIEMRTPTVDNIDLHVLSYALKLLDVYSDVDSSLDKGYSF